MNKNVSIEDSNIFFDNISTKEYYPKEFDKEIKESNVLILPFENFREGYRILFPETTRDLYNYLKEREENNYKVEVVASDNEFKEIELHDAIICLASLLIEATSTIVLGLITNFLFEKIKNYGKNPTDVGVKIDVFYQKTNKKKTTRIKYEGPASEMHKTLIDTIKEIEKNDNQ